ncbi:hypothetical protein AgCh_030166 [Apium graveolens]
MKFSGFLFVFIVLFAYAGLVSARKGPKDYWKRVMNGKPMPEAIRDLYYQDSSSQSPYPSLQNLLTQNPVQIQKKIGVGVQLFWCNPPIHDKSITIPGNV